MVLLPSAVQICGFVHSFLRKDNKVSCRGLFPLFSLYEYLGFISASLLPYLIVCLANETHNSSNPKDACISSEAWLKEESPVSMGCRSTDSAESFHVHGPILSPKSDKFTSVTNSHVQCPGLPALGVCLSLMPISQAWAVDDQRWLSSPMPASLVNVPLSVRKNQAEHSMIPGRQQGMSQSKRAELSRGALWSPQWHLPFNKHLLSCAVDYFPICRPTKCPIDGHYLLILQMKRQMPGRALLGPQLGTAKSRI